jgi:FkbM family methyltransferase
MDLIVDLLAKLSHDNSGSLRFLHKTVSNWHEVLLMLAGTKKSITIKLRNGKRYNMRITQDFVESNYKNRRLRFHYGTSEEKIHAVLMIIGEFFDEPHSELDVNGRDVVDIGAYIGDTAIYFALNGARHVYAFEPYPYSYRLAKRNVAANHLEKKITVVNAGCGAGKGSINIDESYKNLAGSEIKSSKSGKKIPIMPLDSIAKRYHLEGAALKIDCEGCEYGIILNSRRETLNKFKNILIEYHYGYPKLEKKLKECAFMVRHTNPERMKNANTENQEMYGGTIFAKRDR